MSEYEVTIKQIEIYVIRVEADDEKSAKSKAFDIFDSEEDRAKYHNDSDTESTAIELSKGERNVSDNLWSR